MTVLASVGDRSRQRPSYRQRALRLSAGPSVFLHGAVASERRSPQRDRPRGAVQLGRGADNRLSPLRRSQLLARPQDGLDRYVMRERSLGGTAPRHRPRRVAIGCFDGRLRALQPGAANPPLLLRVATSAASGSSGETSSGIRRRAADFNRNDVAVSFATIRSLAAEVCNDYGDEESVPRLHEGFSTTCAPTAARPSRPLLARRSRQLLLDSTGRPTCVSRERVAGCDSSVSFRFVAPIRQKAPRPDPS